MFNSSSYTTPRLRPITAPDKRPLKIAFARQAYNDGVMVYNFELDAPASEVHSHMISANGLVTGDVRTQATLNKYTLPWDKK